MNLSGPIPTFYGSNGCEAEVLACKEILARAQPRIVQLHTWSPERATAAVRDVVPGVRIVCGFGVDSIARDVAQGTITASEGVKVFVRLARRAQELGAIAVVWNAEASWKRPPTSEEAARLAALIRSALATVAAAYPALEQHHTAYDHPTYHSAYPWKAWLGPGSPIVASWPQVYAAPGGNAQAHRGALPRRETRAIDSWAAAIRAGWITPDDASTPVREGVAWRPYLQLHHVPTSDTVTAALRHPAAMLWALRSRSDAAGRLAFLALCFLYRVGLWRPGGVEEYQRSAGLTPDGVCGPATLAAMGAVDPP